MIRSLNQHRGGLPYWQLSSFYFFFFCTVGALMPYLALYLQHLGLNAASIGELIAILVGTKVFAPYLWGWLADRYGCRMRIVRLASLAACCCFVGLFFAKGYLGVAAVMLVFGFFWNAALPQFEAATLNHLGEQVHGYAVIRVWGSVGFILTVAGLGWVLERHEITVLPWTVLLLLVLIWLSTESVPEQARVRSNEAHPPLWQKLRQPSVLALFLCCLLILASHSPYYTFFSIFLEAAGYRRSTIGALWALAVVAEIGVFLVMHRLLPRFGCRALILFSLWMAVLRWLLCGWFVDNLWLLMLAQCLHAATFGTFHAAAIHLIHRQFTGHHQGRGQALYNSMSFGLGGVVGTFASGHAWDRVGAEWTYTFAAGLSLVACFIYWRWGREDAKTMIYPEQH